MIRYWKGGCVSTLRNTVNGNQWKTFNFVYSTKCICTCKLFFPPCQHQHHERTYVTRSRNEFQWILFVARIISRHEFIYEIHLTLRKMKCTINIDVPRRFDGSIILKKKTYKGIQMKTICCMRHPLYGANVFLRPIFFYLFLAKIIIRSEIQFVVVCVVWQTLRKKLFVRNPLRVPLSFSPFLFPWLVVCNVYFAILYFLWKEEKRTNRISYALSEWASWPTESER